VRAARRRALVASAAVLTFGLFAVLAAASLARNRQGLNPLFVSGVLLLGAILTIVVVFVLGRNLVKLYLDRGRGVPGSRYRTKVILLVAGFTLLPSGILFLISSGMIQAAVEQWFRPEVEAVVVDGIRLLNQYEAAAEERGLRHARHLAAEIADEGLLSRRRRGRLEVLLASKRQEYGVAGLRVYGLGGELVAESYEPVRAEGLAEVKLPERALRELLEGGRRSLRHAPDKTGELLLLLGVPIEQRSRVVGAMVIALGLGLEPSLALSNLNQHYQAYQQAQANRQSIRQGFVLVLALFTLVLLFSAIWVGSALAKTMTVPLQRLAEATQLVSEGRLDVRVDVEAADEVGTLVQSFNHMLEELRLGRLKVDRSTRDLQKSNVEIEERRRYIETILDNSPTGVMSLDEQGRVTNLNRAAQRMFGFPESPPPLIHYRELLAGKEFLELRILIDKVLGVRDIGLVRELRLRVERQFTDLAVSFSALCDARGRYLGLILVLEDLSNLIKAQKVAAWREVARRIAHEIKNPLTPIQLSAQRIQKKWRAGDPEVGRVIEDCTDTIIQYVDSLKTLVNEFSRFARMPPVAPVPTDLDKVIASTLALYEGVHPGLAVQRRVASDIPVLNVDPEQIKRVLINLVDNAIQAQNGSGRVVVEAVHDTRTQSVRLEVADEGPGIAPEDRDKLFVPYFSTRPGGTGLGLAIVHRIVSDHGGNIRVEDNRPRGVRFVIELPA
jgi:two-component system nitrogen regulation sensor histidine kinase NtrY